MSVPKGFKQLVGSWRGSNRLHLGDWGPTPLHESAGTATITERVAGQCLEIAYTWEYDGKPQEGMIVLSGDNKTDAVKAFWTDSWHLAHALMQCDGNETGNGSISVKGNYKVEGHPDWGWRSEFVLNGEDLAYKMFNVSPEGEESIAVEMDLART